MPISRSHIHHSPPHLSEQYVNQHKENHEYDHEPGRHDHQ